MTHDLLAAATHLADVIAAENAALAALDLPTVAAAVAGKERAAQVFAAAVRTETVPIEPTRRRQAESVGRRLAVLAEENRRLLERAIAAQVRVIEIIARATRRELSSRATRYGAFGSPIAAARPCPV